MQFKKGHIPKIVVVGSSSIDLVLVTEHAPKVPETIVASSSENFFGGKGANQAVAAARLGASVHMVGSVGMDPYGQQVLRNLVNENVNVGFVHENPDEDTGTAYVTSSPEGNAIVVVSAANASVSKKEIDFSEKIIAQADLVLVQMEIPNHAVEYVFKKCKDLNVKAALYAAPASPVSHNVTDYASVIVAKSNDLSLIFGEDNREKILERMPNRLFVRDDTNSTIYYDGSEMKYFRMDPNQMVYKMGMGDAFTAGYAIAYCHGNSVEECVKFGNDVSLKVTTKRGSQTALPYLSDYISEE